LARAARARYRHELRSRSIRRAIMRHGGKESRFRRDVNHCISKSIVAKAKGTARGIALENLKGITIRTVKRLRRKQRSRHGSWSFYQLRTFIEYKAKMLGVPVVVVDPRNTSRTCAECGHSERANRQSQSRFQCRRCGHTANADVNAARNISRGVAINRPMVSERRRFRSLASTGTSCSNNS
jgi:IS605 OrfB family transposase